MRPSFTLPRATPRLRPRDSVAAGLTGAAVSWGWLVVVDAAAGTPLRLPARLGYLLLSIYPLAGPPPGWVSVGVFTAVHALAWVGAAALVAYGLRAAARTPSLVVLVTMLSYYLQFAWFFVAADLAQEGLGAVAWRGIFVANVLGWAGAWWVLLRRHPEVRSEWGRALDED